MNMTKISRELMTSLNFRPFSKNDYYGFCGVSSPVPMIAENEDEGILMIVDGDYAELYAYDGDGAFDIIDQVDSIRELPFKSDRDAAIEAEIKNLEEALAALKNELCY
jgi:hypothetical protein